MIERAIQAALLDRETYELVEKKSSYTFEAALIVVVTSVMAGLGAWIGPGEFDGFIAVAAVGLIGWVVWAGVALWIGTTYFEGDADFGQMLRVLGYAQVPMALAIIPFFGLSIGRIWTLIAAIVAVKHGMDFNILKATVTALVGWVAVFVAQFLLGWFL